MNLKRDTEFTLRIVLELIENKQKSEEGICEMTLSELSKNTKIPRQIVKRICELLCRSQWISSPDIQNKMPVYRLEKDLISKSILDIVELIEGGADLFHVFDHTESHFKRYRSSYEQINFRIYQILSECTVKKMIKNI